MPNIARPRIRKFQTAVWTISVLALALFDVTGCASPTSGPGGGMADLSTAPTCDGFNCMPNGCNNPADCPMGKMCDPNTHTCQACLADSDCPNGQLCSPGAMRMCVPGCAPMHGCGDGGVCEGDAGQCVQCLADTDCTDPANPRCDPASHNCFPCYTQADNCGHATYCASKTNAYTCASGCKDDTDCAPLPVDAGMTDDGGTDDGGQPDGGSVGPKATSHCEKVSHMCTQCLVDDDCPASKLCKGNVCVDGCTNMHACAAGLSCCTGACVDETTDFANCGACGNACGGGFNCCGSVCSNPVGDVNNCNGCGIVCKLANATPICSNRMCAIGMCSNGYGDCDANAANGCEVNLNTDPAHCGTCANACMLAHASPKCNGGGCGIDTCLVGYADCNGKSADGCEINILGADLKNCGGCGTVCTVANGTPQCAMGLCKVASCNAGWGDCDGDPKNGCEIDLTQNVNNCNTCNNACKLANATPQCTMSACAIQTCNPGFLDCNMVSADGCEVNSKNDIANCGGCGKLCSNVNGAPSCVAGACAITCTNPFADCNKNVADGCEANLNIEIKNCGGCGIVCNGTNGTPSCAGGICKIACNANFGDCNANANDGCETNLQTTVTSCGSCGTVCNSTNGAPSCNAGVCQITCNAGWGNCDGNLANGCETNLFTSVNACGTCNTVCNGTNGSPSCAAGSCQISCNANWGNCDGNVNNGCETNLLVTVSSCGACMLGCPGTNMSSNTCTAGACTGMCAAGYGDCDNNLRLNGCEINLNTNVSSCGACQMGCSGLNMTSNTCTGGACTGTCAAGYGDCDANLRSNGCETNLKLSVASCGGCGLSCPGQNMSSNTCTAGNCTGTCANGFGDCDNNLRTNGCEVNIQTSAANCGGCALACSGANMSVNSCAGGVCTGTCAPNYADCDANLRTNGCEINVSNNVSNCGGCGQACSANGIAAACAGGSCEGGVCAADNFDLNGNKRADGCECAAAGTNTCGSREVIGVLAWATSAARTAVIPGTQGEHWYDVAWQSDGSTAPPLYHPHVSVVTNNGTGVLIDVYTYDCALSGNFGCAVEGGGLSLSRTVWESNQTAGDTLTGATQGAFVWTLPAPGDHVLVRVRGTDAKSCSGYTITFTNG